MLAQLRGGVKWTYASMVVGAVIQVGVTAATARMLGPEAFGLIAMANVVLRFGGYVAQMGVGRALIQRSSIDDGDVRAAFTSSTLLGLAVATIVVMAAPLAATYYQTADVVPVIRWLALTFVLAGVGATASALMQRELRFRASGTVSVISYALGYAVPTLSFAAAGFGAWSLVAGMIGQVAVGAALGYAITRHAVRPSFDLQAHRRLLGFGAKVSGISFLEFIGSTLDALVIGRYGSPAQLGLYNRAFMLASLPTYRVADGLARVLFPVLSAGRKDRAAFSEALVVVTGSAIKLMVPLGIGMAVAAPEIVFVVLGEAWAGVIPLFAILAPALALNVLITFPGLALESMGVLRDKALAQAAYVVILGASLVGSAAVGGFDLRAVAMVVGLSMLFRAAMYFALTVRAGIISGARLRRLLMTLVTSAALASVVMTTVLATLRTIGAGTLLTLLVAIAVGACLLAIGFRREAMAWLRRRRAVSTVR